MLNNNILLPDVQRYLADHQHEKASIIALRKSPFQNILSSELAQQVDGRQRTQKKIPEWLNFPGIYFPPQLNLEQSSSTLTGKYKTSLLIQGCNLIDLTGGYGVDSYFFSSKANSVVHCEINTELSEIVKHNFSILGIKNVIFYALEGIEILRNSTKHFDYIYLDPSRRVKNRKVFRLQDCIPNVTEHQELFFAKSETVITKLAPLLDISLALNTLKHVKSVHVLSVDNDCKELIFVQQKGFSEEPTIHPVLLNVNDVRQFAFKSSQERNLKLIHSQPLAYLYDPDVAVTKSGAFKTVSHVYNVSKLDIHTHLYTSQKLQTDFPGRKYKIIKIINLKDLKKTRTINQANVVAKNFPLKVEEIRKKYKIKDGGFKYLYFCTLSTGGLVAIYCERLPEVS